MDQSGTKMGSYGFIWPGTGHILEAFLITHRLRLNPHRSEQGEIEANCPILVSIVSWICFCTLFFWLLDWMLFDLGSVFEKTLGWWVLLDNRAQWSNEVVYDAKSRPKHWINVYLTISLWCKHFESHRGPWLGHMWATMTVNAAEYMSKCKSENWKPLRLTFGFIKALFDHILVCFQLSYCSCVSNLNNIA